MRKTLLFSVTADKVLWDFFAVGGNGGSGKDTSNTGVRVTHCESGAHGRATEHRSQMQNRRLAFRRMAESPEFIAWCKREAARLLTNRKSDKDFLDERVDVEMRPKNLLIEGRSESGEWLKIESSE